MTWKRFRDFCHPSPSLEIVSCNFLVIWAWVCSEDYYEGFDLKSQRTETLWRAPLIEPPSDWAKSNLKPSALKVQAETAGWWWSGKAPLWDQAAALGAWEGTWSRSQEGRSAVNWVREQLGDKHLNRNICKGCEHAVFRRENQHGQ